MFILRSENMRDVSYIDRMENEKEELEIKLAKMDDFMRGNANKLMVEERILMYHQRQVMKEYIRTLEDRIGFALTKEEVSK